MISVKETIPNPFEGAEFRHPLGCSRQALIAGKYGGGVFCNLTDGVTVMCNYSFPSTRTAATRPRASRRRFAHDSSQIEQGFASQHG